MANRTYLYTKTAAPVVGDDTADGYKIGDVWLDTTNDKIYQAIDVTAGAAVWKDLTVISSLATNAETIAGSSSSTAVTPAGLLQSMRFGGQNGFTLSNNGSDANNDIDIAVGFSYDSTLVYPLRLSSGLTKRLDASWAVGTNQGGLDTGAKANSTFYYVYVIRKDSDSTIDILFSASPISPTLPSGYTYYKNTAYCFRTDGSGNIIPFVQAGYTFWYLSPPGLELSVTNATTTKANTTRTYIPELRVLAICNLYASHATTSHVYISNPDFTDLTPSTSATPLGSIGAANANGMTGQGEFLTNTSGVLSYKASASSTTIRIAPIGWTVFP